MSTEIIGTVKMPKNCKVHGVYPTHSDTISVQCTALQGQRDTLWSTLKGMLTTSGFNRSLVAPVSIAIFPVGFVPVQHAPEEFFSVVINGVERLAALIDGDHRRHLHILCLGKDTVMPCSYIEVATEAEYHWLYVVMNGKGRKNQSNDEIFLQEVKANIAEAVATATLLQTCGLGVRGSSEANGIVGDITGPVVKIGAFLTAIKMSSVPSVAVAAASLAGAYKLQAGDKVHNNLLIGTAIMFELYSAELKTTKMQAELGAYMSAMAMQPQAHWTRNLQRAGGDIHNHQGQSVARGLVREFREAGAGYVSLRHKKLKLPMARVDKLFP